MTYQAYQETIERAIAKAYANGWLERHGKPWTPVEGEDVCFIFGRDFAKALWGVRLTSDGSGDYFEEWQHQLRAMVIAADPIQYLAENLGPHK